MENRTKPDLRKEFLKRRADVDAPSRARFDAAIHEQVVSLPAWTQAETVLCYVSISSEVETRSLIQEALRLKKRVVIPLIDPEWKETLLSELRNLEDLSPGPLKGIPELSVDKRLLVSAAHVDMALIPGLAFDLRGTRLGFGGGFFDRLLPQAPTAIRLALAYGVQISAVPLPAEPHDVRMHAVVTEGDFLTVDSDVYRREWAHLAR